MKGNLLYKIIRPLVILFTKVCIRPKYIGLDNIPKKGAIILAGNHTSILDPLVLISATKRNIHFLAKDELWKGPKKVLFSNLGLIPVNRREKDKYALKTAKEYLTTGEVIGIFPEATTNQKEKLLPFKVGAVKMAKDTNTNIVPFTIIGSYKPLKKLKVVFEKQITIKSDDLLKETDNLRNIIQKVKEKWYVYIRYF